MQNKVCLNGSYKHIVATFTGRNTYKNSIIPGIGDTWYSTNLPKHKVLSEPANVNHDSLKKISVLVPSRHNARGRLPPSFFKALEKLQGQYYLFCYFCWRFVSYFFFFFLEKSYISYPSNIFVFRLFCFASKGYFSEKDT